VPDVKNVGTRRSPSGRHSRSWLRTPPARVAASITMTMDSGRNHAVNNDVHARWEVHGDSLRYGDGRSRATWAQIAPGPRTRRVAAPVRSIRGNAGCAGSFVMNGCGGKKPRRCLVSLRGQQARGRNHAAEDIASDWLGITLILLPIEAAEGHGSMPVVRGRQQLACPLEPLERAARLHTQRPRRVSRYQGAGKYCLRREREEWSNFQYGRNRAAMHVRDGNEWRVPNAPRVRNPGP
jgi:hypothetical protein